MKKIMRGAVAGACLLEVAGLALEERSGGKILPLSEIDRRTGHKVVAPIVLLGLTWHFFAEDWPFKTGTTSYRWRKGE